MIAVLLMVCVAAGIAYPFVQKMLVARRTPETDAADAVATPAPDLRSHAAMDELCPSCSQLNPPDRKTCIECGEPMPVSGVGKLFGGANQQDLIREGIQAAILLGVMLLAMTVANFLPIGGKVIVLLVTVAALGYRMFHVIYN